MPDMKHGAHITVRLHQGVATIRLSRPERLNAIDDDLLRGLRSALERCASDDAVRSVILTGDGKAFCAGQNLDDRDPRKVQHPLDLEATQKDLYHPVIRILATIDKPVITALNGIAAGAGASLALSTDIILAACSARLIFSFVKVGLSVDAGGGWQLVQALGPARARALLLTGATLSAQEAEHMGLIYKCVDDERLLEEATAMARALAEGPAVAIKSIKDSIRAAMASTSLDDYLAQEAKNQGLAGASPDYPEGVLAFLEKRKARFGN